MHMHLLLTAILLLAVADVKSQGRREHSTKIYAVKPDGTLWWYNYKPVDGSFDEPKQVGTDWQNMRQFFSAGGKIYAVNENGSLLCYQHQGAEDGSPVWTKPYEVAGGWQVFKKVFSSNGRIYGIKQDGTLWWYAAGSMGDGAVNLTSAKQVGRGWQDMVTVFGSGKNIYALDKDGALWWYRHTGAADGSFSWEAQKKVAGDWQQVKQAFGSNSRIFVVRTDGSLWLYNHTGREKGTDEWESPKRIATNWGDITKATAMVFDNLPLPVVPNPPPAQQPNPPNAQPANAIDIYGAIGEKYNAMGGKTGFAGEAKTKQLPTADGTGRFQQFAHCVIYWHPAIGAHELHGKIMEYYLAQDARRKIGYPITDQLTCPDGAGKYNHFKKQLSNGTWAESSVYWSPRTRAVHIYGAIREKWKSIGWERSILGYPVAEEYVSGEFTVQQFEKGRILYTTSKGAVVDMPKFY